MYIDGTGTSDLRDESRPLLTLVAVLVDEMLIRPLGESIREITADPLGDVPAGLEFHGVDLWRQKK